MAGVTRRVARANVLLPAQRSTPARPQLFYCKVCYVLLVTQRFLWLGKPGVSFGHDAAIVLLEGLGIPIVEALRVAY